MGGLFVRGGQALMRGAAHLWGYSPPPHPPMLGSTED